MADSGSSIEELREKLARLRRERDHLRDELRREWEGILAPHLIEKMLDDLDQQGEK
jgi:hypothetical protein